jgi:hypothetical protein
VKQLRCLADKADQQACCMYVYWQGSRSCHDTIGPYPFFGQCPRGRVTEDSQKIPFAGAAELTGAEVAEFLLPPTPPRLLLSDRDSIPHHSLQQSLNNPHVATLCEVDACCAAAQEHLKMLPDPLRHISPVALEKILRDLPLHACAELSLPLRLSALWSKCKSRPSSCPSARVEPVRATSSPTP